MKKMIKNIIIASFVFALLCSTLVFSTSAANATIDFGGKSSVTVGDSVTVKVTVKGTYLTGTDINITYDSDILKYVSGGDSGGAGLVHIVDTSVEAGSKSASYAIKFTAKKAGRGTVAVEGLLSDGETSIQEIEASASAKITVNDPVLSSNAKLKSLKISEGTLSPAFSPSTTSYSVKVKNSVTQCTLSAKAVDSDAKVSISKSNPIKLKVGSNTCKITVTAPNGSEKTYTVVIKRSDASDDTSSDDSSSDDTSSDEPEENPLETIIDGTKFIIAKDISEVELFKGFKAEAAEINGETVSVASDEAGIFKIYYLANAEGELAPYTYDTESGIFNKVSYIKQGDYTYIISEFPENAKAIDDYYITNTKIADFDIRCFTTTSSLMSDFYYLYCYNGVDYGVYRYDNIEKVIQRSPDFTLTYEDDIPSEPSDAKDDKNVPEFVSRFNSLTTNAKIIVFCLIAIFIGTVAFITMMLVNFFKRSKYDEDDNQEHNSLNFETIEIDDNNNEE